MLTATINLFGLALAPLYAAIAQVESDRGATSENVYQLRKIYVDDVNRLFFTNQFSIKDAYNRGQSEKMMYLYWKHYGSQYARKTHKPVTYDVLARIHNGGPLGWKKHATDAYWKRVKKVLDTQTPESVNKWSSR